MVKIQLTIVLMTVTVAGRFLAYITQSTHSKRCDRPLPWLAALGGRKVSFRGLWSSPETVTQPKQVRYWWRFLCVFFSVFLRCTPNLNFLAWFFSFKTFWRRSSSGIYVFFMKYSLVILSKRYTSGWRVKGSVSIQILVLLLPEIWKISKNIKFFMITKAVGQIHSLYISVWQWTSKYFF